MDYGGLRRKDTTRGPPLRILSLDGGGVRGYSMLIILQELMHRTFVEIEGRAPKRNEIPKPCEHFDLIVGTGTGGLIALMLGRLRMDIETCKDVYVRMTKRVFETDKTIAGIPYRSTLFKASKLEEAIRECVREHTVYEYEGNDQGDSPPESPALPMRPGTSYSPNSPRVERSLSSASRYSQIGTTPIRNFSGQFAAARWGNPNALLYDARENRTKTAVTAVYKGTGKSAPPVLLRSYDSRREPAPEEKCMIWQAGRATAATALAFKPIQIGQSVFLDEGAGKYNPAPVALDEAVLNEWPGREVGVLISIGTGKRPNGTNSQQHLWWEGFVSSGMGDFAEARRRLISKIEGCEETHKYMIHKHLFDRNVPLENYYRLNVDVGVGEFGMNEWNRLAEISTNTRRYLAEPEVQNMTQDAARKLGAIRRANDRWNRALNGQPDNRLSWEVPIEELNQLNQPAPPAVVGAVELPGEDVPPHMQQHPNPRLLSPTYHRPSEDDKFIVMADEPAIYVERPTSSHHSRYDYSPRASSEQTRTSISRPDGSSILSSSVASNHPPPVPPKTPIQGHSESTSIRSTATPQGVVQPPYPTSDGPPPIVNLAKKPELR
ncbi:uncharacterized protein PV09_05624 [Verruconis gallopava]|uniref:PNPLA domain-containing protein n=1 Tax=Verruconis gallopava TaxID=253628 RepID=A0A0D1XKV5_9PEZI|nr:uncharacterized protein PV09_05624 [Verruconis gallopava]KIW02961.1 hypothetical protein PV09_05624 [Verruconis gallopava]